MYISSVTIVGLHVYMYVHILVLSPNQGRGDRHNERNIQVRPMEANIDILCLRKKNWDKSMYEKSWL